MPDTNKATKLHKMYLWKWRLILHKIRIRRSLVKFDGSRRLLFFMKEDVSGSEKDISFESPKFRRYGLEFTFYFHYIRCSNCD